MKPLRSLLTLAVLLTTGALCARAADTTPPSMPTGLAANLVQGSRVELVWTPATDDVGVTGYRVLRNGVQAGTCTTPSFTDTAGSPGATCVYTVTARDAAGNVSPSSATLSVALGRTYYVAPSGNDANAGSSTAPWATLTKAATTMTAGDLVYVRGGTYTLSATIVPPSGSVGRPITYAGYPGQRATIDGGTGSVMSLSGRSYLTFDNLRFTTAATRVGASMFYMESSRSISFLNCEFFGMPAENGSENTSVIRCMRSSGFTWDCTFRNNYFHDNLSPAIRTYTTNGWVIENNTFVRCREAVGGKDAPNNMLVRRNLIVGGDGAFYFAGQGGSHNVTITENIVINTGTGFVVGGLGTGGNLRESTFLFNNTFFNVANLIRGWDDGYTTAQNYYNNVFYATLPSNRSGGSDSAGRFVSVNRWGGTPIATDDYAIDHNLLQIPSTDPSDRFVVAGQKYQTLETWRVAFPGFDGHSISGDPLFIDAVGGDFHLQATSPCKAAGRDGVDMGAYPRGNDGTIIGSSLAPTAMDIMPPSVPTGLAGAAQSGTSVRLTWTAATDNVGVAGYRIYRDWVQVGTSPAPSFTDSGLIPAKAYRYHLVAFDAAGNACLASPSIQVTTLADTTAPTAPTGLTGTATSATAIQLTWIASADNVGVTSYRIFRDGSQVGTSATTTYTDTGLTTGTSYSYQVVALDAAGNASGFSAAASAVPHDEISTAFAAWVAGNFTAAEQANTAVSGPEADPDRSGLTNLARYAFGLPARGRVASPVALTVSGTGSDQHLVLTFPRKGYAPDLQYTVQSSTDLVTWTDLQSVPPGYPKTFTCIDSAVISSAPRRFLRLRITQAVPIDDAPRR